VMEQEAREPVPAQEQLAEPAPAQVSPRE